MRYDRDLLTGRHAAGIAAIVNAAAALHHASTGHWLVAAVCVAGVAAAVLVMDLLREEQRARGGNG